MSEIDDIQGINNLMLYGKKDESLQEIRSLKSPIAYLVQAERWASHFDESWAWTYRETTKALSKSASPSACKSILRLGTTEEEVEALDEKIRRTQRARWSEKERLAYELNAANQWRRTGNPERAIADLSRVGRSVSELRSKWKPAVATSQSNNFLRHRQTAFRDLLSVARKVETNIFLCSGTLLGLWRDNDFIPADADIDVGVLQYDEFTSLKKALRQCGRFWVKSGREKYNITAQHVLGGKVDVSAYVATERGLAKTSHVYEWGFSGFGLRKFHTVYGWVFVPENTEAYLEEMYAKWWVRMSGYDSRIDSPNLKFVNEREVAAVFATYYLDAVLRCRVEDAKKYLKKIRRLPANMRDSVEEVIKVGSLGAIA